MGVKVGIIDERRVPFGTIDYDAITKHLDGLGYERMAPSKRAQAIQILKDAYAEGRMVAGIFYADESSRQVGCAAGILAVEGGHYPEFSNGNPDVSPAELEARSFLVAVNNFGCTDSGRVPLRPDGLPRPSGGSRHGQPLVRIEPLVELFERCL